MGPPGWTPHRGATDSPGASSGQSPHRQRQRVPGPPPARPAACLGHAVLPIRRRRLPAGGIFSVGRLAAGIGPVSVPPKTVVRGVLGPGRSTPIRRALNVPRQRPPTNRDRPGGPDRSAGSRPQRHRSRSVTGGGHLRLHRLLVGGHRIVRQRHLPASADPGVVVVGVLLGLDDGARSPGPPRTCAGRRSTGSS